ncbi:signal recognition particle protein Srp19, partial [Methanosarcinales archaeon ex4572_44]
MQRRTEKFVIWPSYLDATKSRREGRTVPKKYSVRQPSLKELESAARELG